MVLVEISAKNDKFGYLNPILGKLWPIRVNWTFFTIYYNSEVMGRNVYSSSVFTGGRPPHSNFTWTGSSPVNHFWHQKTKDTGLPDSEEWRPHPSAFPRVNTTPECDRQTTDGQTDRQMDTPYSIYTGLAKLALPRCKTCSQTTFKLCYKFNWYWTMKN